MSKTRPFEYLRLTSLGVIGALVKVGHSLVCTSTHSLNLTPELHFARMCVGVWFSTASACSQHATILRCQCRLSDTTVSVNLLCGMENAAVSASCQPACPAVLYEVLSSHTAMQVLVGKVHRTYARGLIPEVTL